MKKITTATGYCLKAFFNVSLAILSRGFNRELVRRDLKRGQGSLKWFTPEEMAVAETLASIIIPSEEVSPGIDDISMLGPSAMGLFDKLIAECPKRQKLYGMGLLSFDVLAVNEFGRKFAGLARTEQTSLLRRAQETYDDWTANASLFAKGWSRLGIIKRTRRGLYYSAQLYPQIRNDCFQIFYTSRVSWAWLEYDGPPMDEGYPGLKPRHYKAVDFAPGELRNK